MTYADEIRRQVEAAPRAALSAVTAALWRAFGEGQITEAEAEALSGLIEARLEQGGRKSAQASPDRARSPRTGVGSQPRTDASMERRRRWAASGRLPPAIAARFTLAEQGVLALVAAEVARRKDCRLAVGNLAAIVGVAETTVRNAIREAVKLGLVTVEERRITGFRNDTNIVRIISPEWAAWLRLARKPTRDHRHGDTLPKGGGCKSPKGTPTEVSVLGKTRLAEPKKGCRGAAADLNRSDPVRNLAGGRTGRAMR
ncbi:helix-turn-helix domain-containing protein [Methylobacterium sp. E-065]|uniref:helix-turn-helix domain-containing protein n=1 Tax=Methylobacterium sp. E-065 TaxID=2836583 RepID=UPI001FBB6AC4|nr:helix-turn-helix domain-containing protein [Methylobacterium sp. E-065]MCJ2016865.1 helix-turn-helix domain-containing protein [Methylobacterium sp. E-065]